MTVDAFFPYLIEKFYNRNVVRLEVLLFNSFVNDTNVIWKVACMLHGKLLACDACDDAWCSLELASFLQ